MATDEADPAKPELVSGHAESGPAAGTEPEPAPARLEVASAKAAALSAKQWPLLIVVAGMAIGLLIVIFGEWRFGCLVIGSSLGIGAVERVALSNREAGLLRVRGRVFDIVVLIAMGAAIIALAVVVPEGRGR